MLWCYMLKAPFKKDYWKCNADLLKDEEFIKMVRDLIQTIKDDRSINSSSSRWEYFKFKVREFSIQHNKSKSIAQKQYEIQLVQ